MILKANWKNCIVPTHFKVPRYYETVKLFEYCSFGNFGPGPVLDWADLPPNRDFHHISSTTIQKVINGFSTQKTKDLISLYQQYLSI